MYKNFKHVNPNTMHARSLLGRACIIDGWDLFDVYAKPSEAKQGVYDYWWNYHQNDPTANTFHIASHNTNVFTISWYTDDAVILITPTYNYYIPCP